MYKKINYPDLKEIKPKIIHVNKSFDFVNKKTKQFNLNLCIKDLTKN